MATPQPAPFPRSSVLPRLLIAFGLGALMGSFLNTIPILDIVVPLLLLFVPPVIALARDPLFAHKWGSIAVVPALLLVILVVIAITGGALTFPLDPNALITHLSTSTVAMGVILIGFIAAFSLGTGGTNLNATSGWAIACALSAWVGVGVRNFSQNALTGGIGTRNDLGPLILWLIILLYVAGFFMNTFGGALAASLRTWMARRFSR